MNVPSHEEGPYAVVTLISLEHASGKRLKYANVNWAFGHGAICNELGSCLDIGPLWSPNAHKHLMAQNLFPPEIMEAAHLRIESWAHHALMAFTLNSLATNSIDKLLSVDRMRPLLDNLLLEPLVDIALPLDRAKWRTHPAIASGAVRCS